VPDKLGSKWRAAVEIAENESPYRNSKVGIFGTAAEALTCFHDDTTKGIPHCLQFHLVHGADIDLDDAELHRQLGRCHRRVRKSHENETTRQNRYGPLLSPPHTPANCLQLLGDRIIVVVQKQRNFGPESGPGASVSTSAANKVRRGDIRHAVVVRTRKKLQRPDGSVVKFDDNACVLINKAGEPIGTRLNGES